MVKVSHLLSFNCVSFADRRKTPRTKQQRQRKSLRKSARLSKSLEESCPTECCSVMWGRRVKPFFFFKLTYPLSKISRLIEIITILSFQLYRGFGGLDIWNHNGRSVAGLDVSYVLQVYTECWTTTQSFLILKVFLFSRLYIIYLLCSWSLQGGSLTAPPLWQSSTQQIHQWEVSGTLIKLKWLVH